MSDPQTGSVIEVASFYDLQQALLKLDGVTTPGAYTIRILATINETAFLPVVNLASGVTLTIDGSSLTSSGNNQINGGGAYRGLFIYNGKVTVENLAINDTVATGGGRRGLWRRRRRRLGRRAVRGRDEPDLRRQHDLYERRRGDAE